MCIINNRNRAIYTTIKPLLLVHNLSLTIMHIISLNVKGLGQVSKMHEIISLLKYKKVHLALISKTHMTLPRLQTLKEAYPDYCFYFNSPCSDSLGVMFVVLDQNRVKKGKFFSSDDLGQALGIECKIERAKRATHILGIYASNVELENVKFLNGINTPDIAAKVNLILGDFNRVKAAIDRNPYQQEDLCIIKALHNLTLSYGLIDGWRETHENELQYTYSSTRRFMSSSKIDRIYCT